MSYKGVLVNLSEYELVGLEMIKRKKRFENRSVIIREAIHKFFELEKLTPERIEAKIKEKHDAENNENN